MKRICLAMVGMMFSAGVYAGVIYVKWDSPSNGPGTSWSNAYHSIQDGINAAAWEDVWVARGTYNEHIVLKSEIWVYGGFAGNETSLQQRPAFPRPDPDPYAAILDGGRDDELGHVVRVPANAGYHTAIDGFTIQNGDSYWNRDDYPHPGTGGGILIMSGAKATIIHNLIRDNYSCPHGGGVGVVDSSPIISNNIFRNNIAPGQTGGYSFGGGIVCFGGSPVISGNTFEENQAGDGGAILSQNAYPVISDNQFLGNVGWSRGGAINMNLGGGTISGNTIKNNKASFFGNAIWLDHSSPVIQNNLIIDNVDNRSCIDCWFSSPAILNNTIAGNEAAAIYLDNSTSKVNNNIVAFNRGGIYNASGSTPTLRNNDFYGNWDYDFGGGLEPGAGDISADPKFLNYAKGDYHIVYESPCRDAGYNDPIGLPTYDLDGQPRVEGLVVDIGADECWSRIIHVSQAPSAGDSNSGDTWQEAYRHIQTAINVAVPPDRIWVARDTNPYTERITVKPGISLFGGFRGTESSLDERPSFPRPWPDPDETILDAQSLGTVVTIQPDATEFTRIDGFTFTHGDATLGGGLNCTFGNPTLTNCTFRQNHAAEGGGIYLQGASPNIENCIFQNNISTNRGGGIHAHDFCYPLVRYCRFSDCQAQNIDGGAIFADGGAPKIVGNLFTDCYALLQGGAIRLWGADAIITNNTIHRNTSGADGGGIAMQGGVPMLYNNILVLNSSGVYGSGGAAPEMYNNNIWFNADYDYLNITPGPGDISVDPEFAAPAYGDFHLLPTSGCIDKGLDWAPYLPELDLDGQERNYQTVDIGADEWRPNTTYYVATSGDDSDTGLDWGHPLRTIRKALSKCIYGDAVVVANGTYYERIRLRRGVRLGAKPGVVPVLDGQGAGPVVECEPGAESDCYFGYFRVINGNAGLGGGINITGASPLVRGIQIVGNEASEGGGIYLADSQATLEFCEISGNAAQNRGGGIHCSGASAVKIKECLIYSNNTILGDGGGIFSDGGSLHVSLSHLHGNTAGLAGGGIRCWGSDATLAGNIIEWNSARYGAGIHLFAGSATITSNTIGDNWVTEFGGGIDCDGTTGSISNNIVAVNSGGIFSTGGSLTLRNNDIYGNLLYSYWGISPGQGDIESDPLFVSGQRRLRALSPCIDTGWDQAPSMPSVDYDHTARIQGEAVDMGAYERPCSFADMTGDCKVNLVDFAVVAAAWYSSPGEIHWNPACNLAPPDNQIDLFDLAVFSQHWLGGAD